MNLYLDSSAWVKLYVDEPGRQAVITAVNAASIKCSHLIAYVEVHAAMARLLRMGSMKQDGHQRALERFEGDWLNAAVIQVDNALVRRGAEIAFAFGLRGYDSLHLAAAELMARETTETIEFACFDRQLNSAAKALSMKLMSQD